MKIKILLIISILLSLGSCTHWRNSRDTIYFDTIKSQYAKIDSIITNKNGVIAIYGILPDSTYKISYFK